MLREQLGTQLDNGIKFRVMYIILFLLVAALSLSACSSNQQAENDIDIDSVYDEDTAIYDENTTVDSDFNEYSEFIYTLDDISSMQGLYAISSSEDAFKPINTTNEVTRECGYDENKPDLDHSVTLYEYGKPIVIDRTNGEQLAIVGDFDSGEWMCKVSYNGFYQGTGISADIEDYEEIGGEETGSSNFDISSHGIEMHRLSHKDIGFIDMMTSPTELHVDAGWYEGTSWIDGTINLDTPYYIAYTRLHEIRVETILELTKNGYFLIDISNLEKGIYVYASGSLDGGYYYLFEIV